MKQFFKKPIVFVPLLIVIAIFVLFANVDVAQVLIDWREARMQKAIEAEDARIEALYRADFDGGKTPEETLDLFIAALRENNPERAAKYYELSLQEEALVDLKEEKENNGNLELAINYYFRLRERGIKKCADSSKEFGGCTFEFRYVLEEEIVSRVKGRNEQIVMPKGSEAREAVSLSPNRYTNIWKITQL